ncbi:MAG TPA: hypothetical protein VNX01_00550 [Bacteroidia bacterium]|jgi:hypothetical protein|nr:hypothetical protein [Bacteroidia bacterium]
MRKLLLKATTLGLLITLIASCDSNKQSSSTSEKITFPVVEFTISATSDTTIFGQQGTRLFIEKGTFQFADGTPITDSIKIKIKEFYKKSDIALADLSTESDGKIIETGGMLNISATSGGKEIEIKSDKRIVVHFPKPQNSYNQMNLFYSGKKTTDTSVTNWKVDTVNLVKKALKLGSYGWEWPTLDDSTDYGFKPKNYVDTGYYWNPIDFYVSAYNFTDQTKKEIESNFNRTNSDGLTSSFNGYGVECEMIISIDGKIENAHINSKISNAAKDEIISFIKNVPTLEPGKNKFGKVIERKGFLFITGGNIIPLYKTNEEYVKSFDSKYSKYEKTTIKNMDDAELNYYVFSVAKLGWINCDRFLESEKTVDYFVQTQDKDIKIKMVFKEINGVLMANITEDGKFVFSKVPIGKQVTIFALKNVNGLLQTAFQEVTTSDKPLKTLSFKETTLAQLKQQLEKLN